MTKEQLKNRTRKTHDVAIDDEMTLTVRKLSAGQTDTLNRSYRSEDKALEGMRYVFACCVIGDNGEPLFSTDKAKLAESLTEIAAMDHDMVEKVAREAMKFSGLKVSEADAKNG